MDEKEFRTAITAATAPGVIALQGLLQLGVSLREQGLDPKALVPAAQHMQDIARQYEANLDPRFHFILPDLRQLLDLWAFEDPSPPS